MQSYLAGLAASGALISVLRMVTKAAFEKSNNGLRKGASMLLFLFTMIIYIGILYCLDWLILIEYYISKCMMILSAVKVVSLK